MTEFRGYRAEVTELENGTEYAFRVRAVTDAGVSEWSDTAYGMPKAPQTPQNQRPLLEPIEDQRLPLGQGETDVLLDAVDPDGDALYYAAVTSHAGVVSVHPMSLTEMGPNSQLTLVPNQLGTAVIAVSVSDGQAGVTQMFTVTVTAEPVLEFDGSGPGELSFTADDAIAPITMPALIGAKGEVRYTITPQLDNGLSFDALSRGIRGTPLAAAARLEYQYTAETAAGDSISLSFSIAVEGSEAEITPIIPAPVRSGSSPHISQI